MAESKLNAVHFCAHTTPPPKDHPLASPGYGKRAAPEQPRRSSRTFSHLPPREAAIAAYVDRLPDGADISVKTLAKVLPFGQCALRTALNNLQRAGHLRRGREHVRGSDSARWVTRTWFSREARDDDWWAAFASGRPLPPMPPPPEPEWTAAPCGPEEKRLAEESPQAQQTHPEETAPRAQDRHSEEKATQAQDTRSQEAAPRAHQGRCEDKAAQAQDRHCEDKAAREPDEPDPPPPAPQRSRPFEVLASLGLVNPQLSLSSSECATLAPLVAQWFERGVDEAYVVHALTAGLPPVVHSPAGLTRRRLTDKLPPQRPDPVETRPTLRVLECAKCGAPGPPDALPGGLCAPCRGTPPAPPHPAPLTPAEVRARADRARAASARTREGTRT